MKEIKLNATPVRTSENFGMNDVILKDFHIPREIPKFDGITIQTEEVKVVKNVARDQKKLQYGMGKELEEQVSKEANQSLQIQIEKNKKGKVEITFDLDKENACLVDHIEIEAEEESKASVIIKYQSGEKEEAYHNGICTIKAHKNADIQIILVNLLGKRARHFMSVESDVEEGANCKVLTVDFGGRTSVSNYYVNVSGKKANGNIDTIYLGKKEQLLDINYIGHLRGEKSNVNIEVQGALKDTAVKNFKGTIDFKTGAKMAKGNENEFCMLLSDKAKSKALPMLLCTEDDVEGSHSTASGKVNEQELFYLMSRGFETKEAMKLMVKAKFSPIIDKIEEEVLREEILKEVDRQLD